MREEVDTCSDISLTDAESCSAADATVWTFAEVCSAAAAAIVACSLVRVAVPLMLAAVA